ncbi:MAG: exonuclease domain-containing protein [Rhodoglobus sp.]
MTGFAVLDLETTGLFPGGHDRIVEIAVIHTDERGKETQRWDTLVNPGRDLGPQHIHGIRAEDVLDAPAFGQITSDILELVSGRVVVAHNASFDSRFLLAELERSGVEIWQPPSFLCTMQLATRFLPGSGRALADCCAAYDIELTDAHCALRDAVATARLLEAYIGAAVDDDFWGEHLAVGRDYRWPTVIGSVRGSAKPRPAASAERTAASFLERITTKLPDFSGPAEARDYLAMLDRALLDRHLSAHETNALVLLAEDLGIDRSTAAALHAEYFEALAAVAWADGVLTDSETADLLAVADLLDLPDSQIDRAMTGTLSSTLATPIESFRLEAGDLVVLTGDMRRPREAIELDLIARGYVPWAGVTKKVKLVVAADPDSLSGKARKARDYGIPVVGERMLEELLA